MRPERIKTLKISLILCIFLLIAASASSQLEASTQQEWNTGNFSGTTADRPLNEGTLGLGYRNGTSDDSLIGYWRLDRSVSGSGGTVKDYSGNKNNGVAKNGVTTGVDGIFSTQAFSFDGNDDYVNLPSINPTNEITVSSWVKSSQNKYNALWSVVSKYDAYILGPRKSDDKRMCFIIHSRDNGWNYDSCYSVDNPDVWHHFVGTYDSSTSKVKLYMDGELVASDLNSGGISDDTGSIHLGHREGDPVGTDHFNGKIDETKIYNTELSEAEIKQLYLRGKPFSGDYSRRIDAGEKTKWNKIEVEASAIPSGTDVDAVFRPLDSSGTPVDQQVIDLSEGKNNYSLDVSDGEKAEIVFNGSSSDVTKSWRIDSFKVFSGFCDYRGPENECVMNSTRQLSQQVYNVESVFESKRNAVFEAFEGAATVNVSNSSILSGLWRGSFFIKSDEARIVSGAKFRPEGSRIIIGR